MKTVAGQKVTVDRQRTLSGPAVVEGRGLFTGAESRATLRPGAPGTGVVFVRTDLPGSPPVPARVEHVAPRPRRTCLRVGEAVVETVEHCLSAMAGMGIDNAVVELTGEELPAGDGSARPFVEAIVEAGPVEQGLARDPIVLSRPITVADGDATLTALPSTRSELDLMYDLHYGEEAPLGRQVFAIQLDSDVYVDQIAPARTYALAGEARSMRERGMFTHLRPSDVLVIDETGPIDNEFRFPDEPARHKILDLLGDLTLAGRPIHGRVIGARSGHALNHRLVEEIVKQAETPGGEPGVAPAMDIRRILGLLPHRYPMVLVDRVLEIEGDRRAVGVKNVTINEPFFQGHYPVAPIMPGVLIVEAMSQLAGLMLSQKLERTGKVAILLSLENVKLRRSVTPGDQLILHAEAMRATSRFGECRCWATVESATVAEARVKFMMVDAEQEQ